MNLDDDNDDNYVPNEDDLVKVTFRCSYDLASLGVGTVKVSRTNSKIRLWKAPSKGGPGYELEFSYNGMDKMYNLAEMGSQNAFRDEILNKTYWIEGAEPSQDPKDTGLRLQYEGAGQGVEITVVTFDLDVNNSGDIEYPVDGTVGYMPGYRGDAPWISYQGIDYVSPQAMQLIAKPLNWAEITSVHYSIVSSSHEPGFCMNSGVFPDEKDKDYSFEGDRQSVERDASTDGAKATAPFFCKDFGAWGAVRVTIKRGDEVLFEANRKVPSDGNDNYIADAWTIGDGGAARDDTDCDPAGDDFPGDGLSRYEEYRGFLVSGSHVRTDPTKKDVFVCNKDVTDAGVSGFFTTESLGAPVHVLIPGEYVGEDVLTRIINARSSPATHCEYQAAIVVLTNTSTQQPGRFGYCHHIPGQPHIPINSYPCEVYINNIKAAATHLSGGINETQTTIPALSMYGFCDQYFTNPWTYGTINIDGEIIKYTGTTATEFTGCTRGFCSTLPASHQDFAPVSRFSDPATFIKNVFAHEAGHACNLQDWDELALRDTMVVGGLAWGATLGEQFWDAFPTSVNGWFRVAP